MVIALQLQVKLLRLLILGQRLLLQMVQRNSVKVEALYFPQQEDLIIIGVMVPQVLALQL